MANDVNIVIVGAGLAGSEAALTFGQMHDELLENFGINLRVDLFEMRGVKQTAVHKTNKAAELVCSNSLKSLKANSASGMLKRELAAVGSPLLLAALNNRVDAGGALAVDRNEFSNEVDKLLRLGNCVHVKHEEVQDVEMLSHQYDLVMLATGPLTSNALSANICKLTGQENMAFYDAAAPIVMADSLDMSKIFTQDRYGKGGGDYLNAAMDKPTYEAFISELLKADRVIDKNLKTSDLFQACQPIEEVAKTGIDSPRFGALKPVGITDPNTGKRPWAVVQLRAENAAKTAYNLVGFQTNLKYPEQRRVFGMIPGLKNAEFARYGVMHRNTFINAPALLNENLHLKTTDNIYFAGQLSGTEGYVEAIASGHWAALSVMSEICGNSSIQAPNETAFGSLLAYATNPDTLDYQPMHVNFGIIPPLDVFIKNKQERYAQYARRGGSAMSAFVANLCASGLMGKNLEENSKKILKVLDKIML